MTDESRGLQLSLPSKPENVAVVRHAIAGLAEAIGMDEPGIADLKSVVTEACMNVAVHAYEDTGPMEVEAIPQPDGLTVVVRDYGTGIRPRAEFDPASLRLGLPLIAALAQSFEIAGGLDRGTRITMHVPLRSSYDDNGAASGAAGAEPPVAAPAATELTVESPELLGPVLSRVLGALAARRDLTIDRLSDAVLLTDALAERAPDGFPDGRVRLALEDEEEGIDMRLGPLPSGGGERLRAGLELPQVGASLERLADEVAVTNGDDGEYLVIRFSTATG